MAKKSDILLFGQNGWNGMFTFLGMLTDEELEHFWDDVDTYKDWYAMSTYYEFPGWISAYCQEAVMSSDIEEIKDYIGNCFSEAIGSLCYGYEGTYFKDLNVAFTNPNYNLKGVRKVMHSDPTMFRWIVDAAAHTFAELDRTIKLNKRYTGNFNYDQWLRDGVNDAKKKVRQTQALIKDLNRSSRYIDSAQKKFEHDNKIYEDVKPTQTAKQPESKATPVAAEDLDKPIVNRLEGFYRNPSKHRKEVSPAHADLKINGGKAFTYSFLDGMEKEDIFNIFKEHFSYSDTHKGQEPSKDMLEALVQLITLKSVVKACNKAGITVPEDGIHFVEIPLETYREDLDGKFDWAFRTSEVDANGESLIVYINTNRLPPDAKYKYDHFKYAVFMPYELD